MAPLLSKGLALVAVPLSTLKFNYDYFVEQRNGDAWDLSIPGGTTGHDLLNVQFDLPDAGDYLVLMSAEGRCEHGTQDCLGTSTPPDSETFQAYVDTGLQKAVMRKEWESDAGVRNWSYVRVHGLAAGLTTFKIVVGGPGGNNTKRFRRARIIVLRAATFDQMPFDREDADITTLAVPNIYDNMNTVIYNPNQTEHVVVLGNLWGYHGTPYRSILARLYNQTTSDSFADFASNDERNPEDRAVLSMFASEQVSGQNTYHLQIGGESPYATAHHFSYSDLVVWSMTVPGRP